MNNKNIEKSTFKNLWSLSEFFVSKGFRENEIKEFNNLLKIISNNTANNFECN